MIANISLYAGFNRSNSELGSQHAWGTHRSSTLVKILKNAKREVAYGFLLIEER